MFSLSPRFFAVAAACAAVLTSAQAQTQTYEPRYIFRQHVEALSAAPAPVIALFPQSLDFGSLPVGSPAQASATLVTNGSTFEAIATRFESQGPSDFTFDYSDCERPLAPTDYCAIGVAFSPLQRGSRTSNLSIEFNGGVTTRRFEVSGQGLGGELQASAPSLDFGRIERSVVSEAQGLQITNVGEAPVSGLALSSRPDFNLTSNCSALAAGQSCNVSVTFSPSAAGWRTYPLTVASSVGPLLVELKGFGTNYGELLKVVPATLEFGNVDVGQSKTSELTLLSQSPTPLELDIGEATAPFSTVIEGTTCTASLAPGASCFVQIRFAPATAGELSAYIPIGVGPEKVLRQVPLNGTGTDDNSATSNLIAGGNHVFVQAGGTWYGRGANAAGQLGIGSFTPQTTWVPVPALSGAVQIVAGHEFTFVKKADGSWHATGSNGFGQLGLGDTSNRTTFVPVPAIQGATSVTAGPTQVFARMPNGQWLAAGYNAFGQLGTGDTANRTSFSSVPGLNGASEVVSGYNHTFARVGAGWKATGQNSRNQLLLGTGPARSTFVDVPAVAGASQIVLGSDNTFVKSSSGAWSAVGQNSSGSLGIGTTAIRYALTALPLLDGASTVIAAGISTYAQLPNGDWWATGYNGQGELGLGDLGNRSSFVRIPGISSAYRLITGPVGGSVYAVSAADKKGTGANYFNQLSVLPSGSNNSFRTSFTPMIDPP